MKMTFKELFRKATDGDTPFPYQEEFADASELFELVHAPTGSGKTATAILGWLWRYYHSGKPTPRRLVYCLPMRVLVEQTRDEAKKWIAALELPVAVHVLMGGEDADEWDLDPEKPAILIGTQDMLLSRALNRGYGMSRFRWPMHYGLLNNDCLWVLDEIQLMGVGLATSTQLQAFRKSFGTFGNAETIWMSATLLPEWLATVDFREHISQLRTHRLAKADYQCPGLKERWQGAKPIERAKASADDPDSLAEFVKEKHLAASLTLVVVNTVKRSRDLFQAIQGVYQSKVPKRKKGEPPVSPGTLPDIKLIHSRFRPREREAWMGWLKATPPAEGRIIVSTQVVEAGVDVSARTLVTELAPWPSLVQRFGRCNRRGECGKHTPAQAYWIDVPAEDNKEAAPYAKDELDSARKHLKKLDDVGLKSLHEFFEALSDKDRDNLFPYNPPHVIRRKDFVDLFDTTSDLAGNDIDVSRFIREGEELDVQVFWRSDEPPREELDPKEARRIAPIREELCPVPVIPFREFVEKAKKTVFRWDALDGKWIRAGGDAVFPGQVFWIPRDQGGYSVALGWDPKSPIPDNMAIHTPTTEGPTTSEPEYDSDLLSVYGWRSIAEHTDDLFEEFKVLAKNIALDAIPWDTLRLAARWHDWGKVHPTFQAAIKDDENNDGKRPAERAGKRDIAKAAPRSIWRRYHRRHFRHELASALGLLALLRSGKAPTEWANLSDIQQNLATYLVAAHHGKVRLSIRSMPEETKPNRTDKLFARGVWDGDELPTVDLGSGVIAPGVKLDLTPMQFGQGADGSPSWAERALSLRDHPDLGPLRLAFLEAVLRAADMRASKNADEKATVKRG